MRTDDFSSAQPQPTVHKLQSAPTHTHTHTYLVVAGSTFSNMLTHGPNKRRAPSYSVSTLQELYNKTTWVTLRTFNMIVVLGWLWGTSTWPWSLGDSEDLPHDRGHWVTLRTFSWAYNRLTPWFPLPFHTKNPSISKPEYPLSRYGPSSPHRYHQHTHRCACTVRVCP